LPFALPAQRHGRSRPVTAGANQRESISSTGCYKARFGFPFIIAVKGLGKDEILAAFERRLGNDPETERRTALEQVERIALLRLQALLP
jgi:2-oxo-4-hydroxy-4-carboxy--5-ureidoimidazoline (OHCU) decarboxylase